MKKLCSFLLIAIIGLGASSCTIFRHDNGKHKGWYKNPNNPHHPLSTKKKKKGKKGKKPKRNHPSHHKSISFNEAYNQMP